MNLWPYYAAAAGAFAVVALLARRHVAYWLSIAKALTTNPRLPRPLRWTMAVGLAVKAVPVPDFGIDELALGVAAVLLATRYRRVAKQIITEVTNQPLNQPTERNSP